MTCASCAARIEKRLNKVAGVTATVNYATERAAVSFGDDVDPKDLIAQVEAVGYTANLPSAADTDSDTDSDSDTAGSDDELDESLHTLRTRLTVSTILTVPVVVMAMVPALQFSNWQWLSLTLTAPVVVWAGLPFHRAAWVNLRHGAATMDTLISIGTLSAFAWSL